MAWLNFNTGGLTKVVNTDFISRVSGDYNDFYIMYSDTEYTDIITIQDYNMPESKDRLEKYNKLVSDLMRYCCNHKYVVLDTKTGEFNALE